MRSLRLVVALGIAQTLAWASSYYLPAMVADSIAGDLRVTTSTVFAAFSVALIISAVVGPYAGRAIDQLGGRPVLLFSNVVFSVGLFALSLSHGVIGLFAAWAIIGLGMGCGLYESAFATVVNIWADEAKKAITGITLIAGFASTISWPVTSLLENNFGWRGACFFWAALHLTLGVTLNFSLPNSRGVELKALPENFAPDKNKAARKIKKPTLVETLLAYCFAATWFISTSMAVHLPHLLQLAGMTTAAAVWVGALVGPAQIMGRILEFGFLSRWHSLLVARLSALLHPLGAIALLFIGPVAAPFFALLHGAGNGILTIAQGTLPLELFGSQGYGRRQGLLMVPARFIQAGAPFLFGFCIQRWGVKAILFSMALSLSIVGALFFIRHNDRAAN